MEEDHHHGLSGPHCELKNYVTNLQEAERRVGQKSSHSFVSHKEKEILPMKKSQQQCGFVPGAEPWTEDQRTLQSIEINNGNSHIG